MTSERDPRDRDDLTADELAAHEYVLGLMDEPARTGFEARLSAEPGLARLVAATRDRFVGLDLTADGPPPSEALWARIEAGLGAPDQASASNVVAFERPRAPAPAPTSLDRRAFWRGFAAAALVGVVGISSVYLNVRAPAPRLVVVLLNERAEPVSIVEALDDRRIRVVPLKAIDVPEGRTLQVWTLPDPATGPVSMGLLETVRATLLEGPSLPAPRANQLYEITLEPAGGSPTGRPTGPIIGKGFANAPRI